MHKFLRGLAVLLVTLTTLTACQTEPPQEQASGSQNQAEKSSIRSVKTAEAKAVMDEMAGVTVLDVRTANEFAGGHIPGATLVDFYGDDFTSTLEGYDKQKRYLVYCASGGRSSETLLKMKKMGFQNVLNLEGGFMAWKQEGYPIQE